MSPMPELLEIVRVFTLEGCAKLLVAYAVSFISGCQCLPARREAVETLANSWEGQHLEARVAQYQSPAGGCILRRRLYGGI